MSEKIAIYEERPATVRAFRCEKERYIGNSYGVRFIINDASRLSDSCSGTFVRQPVENILSTIECATGIHFKPSGNGPGSYIVY